MGINKEFGGLRMATRFAARAPNTIHCGDTIHADSPVLPETAFLTAAWRNATTAEKSKVETLDEFQESCLQPADDNVRRFNAELPQFWLWTITR
jgi:phosphodiesterase/alkaline phosphatase D-like protein